MKREFIKFLKDNNAYDQYVQNAENDHHADVKGIQKRNHPEHWISAAFDWERTPELCDYWRNLSVKWNGFITKLND